MQLPQQRANNAWKLLMDDHACTEAAHTVLFWGKQGASKFKVLKKLSIISKLIILQIGKREIVPLIQSY